MRLFGRVERADRLFLSAFRRLAPRADCRLVCEQHPDSLLARVALAGQRALDQHPAEPGASIALRQEIAQRAMDRSANEETGRLERHVGFLATTGSVSPFIGLMGTVWGVMSAFLNIGAQGSASLVVVAPGHRRGADRHGRRTRGRDPGGGRLQPSARPAARVRPTAPASSRASSSTAASEAPAS